MKKFLAVFLALCAVAPFSFAQSDIQAARQASIGSTVTIKGIVTNGPELGAIRYVQDSSAGIALYDASVAALQRGDSIIATGTLTDYNNLLEIQPVSTHAVYTSGNPSPAPQVLTPAQLGEAVEGELVRIDNAVFSASGTFAGNTSYTFTASSQTGVVYIRTGSPLVGSIIPTGYVTLYGIASQYLAQYQLLPRDAADIIANSSISIISTLTQSNISQSGFDLSWTTNISGSTEVQYGRTPQLELGTVTGAPGLSHSLSLTGASPADLLYVKALSVNGTDTAFSATRVFATVSASGGGIKVYFDKSVDTSLATGTHATLLFHSIDDTIIAYIGRAHHTIDIAMYSFDNANIANISTALNNAYAAGINIRIISDGSNNNPALGQLNPAIPVIYSPTSSAYNIMHNKFMIIDALSSDPLEPVLWTGSTNWTDNQTATDANNAIIFQDQSIAKGYKLEFEEMWGDTGMVPNAAASRFGPYKTDNTPHEYIIGGKQVESYFSPSDGTCQQIINHMATANTDLCIATMQITRSDMAYAITGASAAGVQTYVLVDNQSTTTVWPTLSAGLPAGHLTDYAASGIMHHKYAIIDAGNYASDPMVITGSHNWSTAADSRNDENTVIVHDSTTANLYYQEFVPRFTQNGGLIGVAALSRPEQAFEVFPNPAREGCTLRFTLASAGAVQLAVYDETGRLLSAAAVQGQSGSNTASVDVRGLAPGVYFIRTGCREFSGVCRLAVCR